MIRVRNLRLGEAIRLPPALLDHGMPYLVEPWVWVVEDADAPPAASSAPAPAAPPFALIVTSFAHGWLVLHRVLAISPLPPAIPLTWFLAARSQVFAEARLRGCVGFLSLLDDTRPEEAQLIRIAIRLAGGQVMPEKLSLCAGPLTGHEAGEEEEEEEVEEEGGKEDGNNC